MFEKDTCCLLLFVCVFMLVLIYFDSDSSGVVEGQDNIRNKVLGPQQQGGVVEQEDEEEVLTSEQETNFDTLEAEQAQAEQAQAEQAQAEQAQAEQAQAEQAQAEQAQGAEEEEGVEESDQGVQPPQQGLEQDMGQIVGFDYDPMYASASSPYGMTIPISMQQDFAILKSLGKLTPQIMQSIETYNTTSNVDDSQMPSFDPTAQGGLLPSQVGVPQRGDEEQGLGVPGGQGEPMGQVPSPPGTPPGSPSPGGGASTGSVEVHMVYAEWCGHSQTAKGPYQQLMKDTQSQQLKTKSGKSLSFLMTEEADEQMEMFKDKIQGFPTFMTVVKDTGGNVLSMDELEISDRNSDTIKNTAMELTV
jgi:hypothetical protein